MSSLRVVFSFLTATRERTRSATRLLPSLKMRLGLQKSADSIHFDVCESLAGPRRIHPAEDEGNFLPIAVQLPAEVLHLAPELWRHGSYEATAVGLKVRRHRLCLFFWSYHGRQLGDHGQVETHQDHNAAGKP